MTLAKQSEGQYLIGALLDLNTQAREMVQATGLAPEVFAENPTLKHVFAAIVRLAEHGRPIDATTVFFEARRSGPIDLGVQDWLISLQANNVLDRAHFEQAASSFTAAVKTKATAMQLRCLAQSLEQRSKSQLEVSSELEALAAQISNEWEPDHRLSEAVGEVMQEWRRAGEPGTRPLTLSTGIKELDEVIGGYAPRLNMIIGKPSIGKSALEGTAFKLQLAMGRKPGLFGLEEGDRWLAKRLIALRASARVRDVGALPMTADQRESADELEYELQELTKNALTYRKRGINIVDLCRRAMVWVTQHGCDSIWVDNLKFIQPRRVFRGNERAGVSEILDVLDRFAVKFQVPVILLAHTKRKDGEDREVGPPDMESTAETADAERFAFNILGLWRKDRSAMRCTVLKGKESAADVTFEMPWLAETALVSEEATKVNLFAERRSDNERREKDREERAKAKKLKVMRDTAEAKAILAAEKAAEKAKAEADEAAKKPAQQSLLGPEPEAKP